MLLVLYLWSCGFYTYGIAGFVPILYYLYYNTYTILLTTNRKKIMNYQWKYKDILYKTRRDITDAFDFTTCVWNAKLRDKEIIKIIDLNQDTSYEDIHADKQQDSTRA